MKTIIILIIGIAIGVIIPFSFEKEKLPNCSLILDRDGIFKKCHDGTLMGIVASGRMGRGSGWVLSEFSEEVDYSARNESVFNKFELQKLFETGWLGNSCFGETC